MTVELLVARWLAYQAAMSTEPYDADKVQAKGMAFADCWKQMCSFDYSLKADIMPFIVKSVSK